MPQRRGSRLILEMAYLLALAGALALADVRPIVTVAAMLGGWLIVVAFERAAWRDEPHFAAGLPPRYHVPYVELPPPQPLELVTAGYPEAQRDEAPTWIASAALRAELLGDWPLAAPAPDTEVEPAAEDAAVVDDASDPWLIAELPVAPIDDPEVEADPEPLRLPEPETDPDPEPLPAARPQALATYHLDPLEEPARRRRFRGGSAEGHGGLQVPARPVGPRPLPGQSERDER